ncbi:MAG: ABC transporter ATP-binding protein [Rikenellaceae bacterium]
MNSVIQCKNIIHTYGKTEVLKGVELSVKRGEVLSIVGRSGAGKSTLLQILGTLLTPTSGEVIFQGNNIENLSDRRLSDFRAKNIGFVFQEHHLLPEFSALENVILSGVIAGEKSKDVAPRATELLKRLGLGSRLKHKPSALSGGENQRVAVARALINSPEVVFADEPTGNLDSTSRSELNNLFFELREELGQTFVIVTHENDLAEMCDRKITMSDGKILL